MKKWIAIVKYGSPCPFCGCTDRTKYEGVKKKMIDITTRDGGQFQIAFYVTRYTTCRRCEKKRMECRAESPE